MNKWMIGGGAAVMVLIGTVAWSMLPEKAEKNPAVAQVEEVVENSPSAPAEKLMTKMVNLPEALQVKETDVVIGAANAPVQIVEYASLTCPHCATFHTQVLPEIKEKFVETGKVKFIYRHLPWDNLAMAAAKIASCAAPSQFENFVGVFMDTQRQWVTATDPLAAMKQLVRLGGMTGEQVDACLANEALHTRILAGKNEALNVLNVKGTPMLFINAQRVEGANRFPILEKIINQELGQ